MAALQADLHSSSVLPGIAGVHGREAGLHADVRNDCSQIAGRDHVTNVRFYSPYILIGEFKTCSGWSLYVDHELTRISPGKEGNTEERIQRETEHTHTQNSDQRRRGAQQRASDRDVVRAEHGFAFGIEPMHESTEH